MLLATRPVPRPWHHRLARRATIAAEPRGGWTTAGPTDTATSVPGVSAQTRADLAAVDRDVAAAERLLAGAAMRLATVRARGDAEAALGMSVQQHLRHTTRLRRDNVTSIALIGDVVGHMPHLAATLAAGRASVDQAAAIARHAARVGPTLRVALDDELAADNRWTGWNPEHLAAEAGRILAILTPTAATERERQAPARQFLHVQPSLDRQAVNFEGRYEGLDAALFDAVLDAASPAPTAGKPRAPQRAAGLARVLRAWACGRHRDHDGDDRDAAPPAVLHVLVDEHTAAEGAAGELWTSIPGLAPTITAEALAELARNATIVTSIARDEVPVAVVGRSGHAIDDPDGLSWDSKVELARLRDGNRCRMPGCDRPIDDIHHLIHRARGGSDRLTNLAGLCRRCHHRVLHRHEWAGSIDDDGRLHLRRRGRTLTSPARKHLRLRKPPPLSDPARAAAEPAIHLDQHGNPLPF